MPGNALTLQGSRYCKCLAHYFGAKCPDTTVQCSVYYSPSPGFQDGRLRGLVVPILKVRPARERHTRAPVRPVCLPFPGSCPSTSASSSYVLLTWRVILRECASTAGVAQHKCQQFHCVLDVFWTDGF